MNKSTPALLSATFLLLASASATPVVSQSTSGRDDVQVHRRNNCRLAHQVLLHGQPANKRDWAIGYVNNCGAPGGEALAVALLQSRSVSTPGGELEKLVQSAASLTDGRVFEAALELASDRRAGVAARVQAIRVAYHQLNPATFQRYEAFVTSAWDTEVWYIPHVLSEIPPVGTPLPPDALQQASRVLDDIVAETAAPRPVHHAAEYLRSNLERQQAEARLCGAGVSRKECSRRIDEWEAQEGTAN